MTEILRTLRELADSKKFAVFLATVVLVVAGRLGFDLDPALVDRVVAVAIAYLVGQGIADHGKSKAGIEA